MSSAQQRDSLINQWLDAIWLEKNISANTRDSYRRDAEAFLRWAQADAEQIDQQRVRQWLQYRSERNLSPRSTARALSALRSLYRWMVKSGRMVESPLNNVLTPRQGMKLPKTLSEAEVDAMMRAVDTQTDLGIRDRAMLELMYGAGLRVSELVNLKTGQIDFDQGALMIEGKGSKQRLVPLGGEAERWIKKYYAEVRPSWAGVQPVLFLTPRGSAYTRQAFWHRVRQVAARAGLQGREVSPHQLRHAFATHLLNRGADLRVVQLLLGHASLSVTQIYTHVSDVQIRELHSQYHPRA